MAYRYNYEKYDTRTLVEIWCFNSNEELCGKVERILEKRGFDLTEENVQKILLN